MLRRLLTPFLRTCHVQISGGGASRGLSLLSDYQLPPTLFGSRAKSTGKKVDLSYLIPEKDLVENIISGWGPGGQAVNKTRNACFIKHVPTGRFLCFVLSPESWCSVQEDIHML